MEVLERQHDLRRVEAGVRLTESGARCKQWRDAGDISFMLLVFQCYSQGTKTMQLVADNAVVLLVF